MAASTILSFLGSLSSTLATATVLVFHFLFQKQRHFRHALIVNLLVADFLNALNNTVSGIFVLARRDHKLPPGPACNFNGWFGQITVQTVDFSILAIAIVVLLTIKKTYIVVQPKAWKAVVLCVLVWLPGTTTSFIALKLSYYGPVSGNWCWVKPSLLRERYLLTHIWRIVIFFSTIIIYVVVHVLLYRIYGTPAVGYDPSTGYQSGSGLTAPSISLHRELPPRQVSGGAALVGTEPKAPQVIEAQQVTPSRSLEMSRKKEVQRILLLNGYPFVYIILWIPGLTNRLIESIRGSSPPWLVVLQSSTQYVGLANALIYGWKEDMWHQACSYRRSRKAARYIRTTN